jgi:endo-beta-N-acetylglucosaminidase D
LFKIKVEVAMYYKFDGWFINIESELRDPAHAAAMIEFIRYLTNAMHTHIPGSKVVWYDSLTIQAKLRWQDQLNWNNAPFLDVCDGIFVNYTWKQDYPSKSAQFAKSRYSDTDEKGRISDIYTGIDIWGRNTFGGGGFNTHKALRLISQARTSAALFAPAWTHESFDKTEFEKIDKRLWCGEPKYLNPAFPPWDPEVGPPKTMEDPDGKL